MGGELLASPPAIWLPPLPRRALQLHSAERGVDPNVDGMFAPARTALRGQFGLPQPAPRDAEDWVAQTHARKNLASRRGNATVVATVECDKPTPMPHTRSNVFAKDRQDFLGRSENSPAPRATNTRAVIIDAGRTECRFRNTRTRQETAVSGVFSPKRSHRPRGTAEDAVAPRNARPRARFQIDSCEPSLPLEGPALGETREISQKRAHGGLRSLLSAFTITSSA